MWNQTDSSIPAEKQPSLVRPRPEISTSDTAGQGAAIGKSLVIKGEVSGSESLYIDGKIEGSINLLGNRVTIGSNGQVAATVTAREVVVQGKIVGNVNASDLLHVRSEGSLTGDVTSTRINLEDGAFFKGKIDIRRPGQPVEGTSPLAESKEAEPRLNGDAAKWSAQR
jgi:cytoskeletal protein CcmA (bactofilin family)